MIGAGADRVVKHVALLLQDLHHFTEVSAARSIHNNVFTETHIRDGGRIEMIDLADFGESDTDNILFHNLELYRTPSIHYISA